MKWAICGLTAFALVAVMPANARDYEFKPIDTKRLVVQPSRTAANLAAGTINLVGGATASAVEGNGYVKTLNNLFGRKQSEPKLQTGRSNIPSPNLYKSTRYPNYNQPVMPQMQYR
jgi:hypothetical protein